MRCAHCNFENVSGVSVCQVCGSRLTGVVCPRCQFENPPDHQFCGACGQSFASAKGAGAVKEIAPAPEPAPPPTAGAKPSTGPSPVILIGFGAILALASASYPWYLLGSYRDSQEQTLSQLLEGGWQWFPGIPLALIVLSSLLSSLVAMVNIWSRLRAIASVGLGLATLFCAAWLWQGYGSRPVGEGAGVFTSATGAMLAVVGAIVLIATGLWMFQTVRSRGRTR